MGRDGGTKGEVVMGRKYGKDEGPTSEYTYQSQPRIKKYRARVNAANRKLGRKGDGLDVSHKRSLLKGGSNHRSNLVLKSPSKNRSRK